MGVRFGSLQGSMLRRLHEQKGAALGGKLAVLREQWGDNGAEKPQGLGFPVSGRLGVGQRDVECVEEVGNVEQFHRHRRRDLDIEVWQQIGDWQFRLRA